jgi:hypothetical protein
LLKNILIFVNIKGNLNEKLCFTLKIYMKEVVEQMLTKCKRVFLSKNYLTKLIHILIHV